MGHKLTPEKARELMKMEEKRKSVVSVKGMKDVSGRGQD
jgi:hypothetical protein